MIDWYSVGVNSLEIFGLAIVLATFSWHDWQRRVLGRPVRQQLRLPTAQLPLRGGLLLVTASFVLMKYAKWWERAVWTALGIGLAWSIWIAWRALRGQGRDG